jgi:hypothetical protein
LQSGKGSLPDFGYIVEPTGRGDEVELDSRQLLSGLDDREQGRKTIRPDTAPDVVLGSPLFFVVNDPVWLAPDGATEAAWFETRRPEKKPKRFKETLDTARGCPERQREPHHVNLSLH